jgi:lysyl-tRNA synthetase class 1
MYSWIEKEVDALIGRTKGRANVTFEIGYGPSGPPHIGTISEAIRTNAVRSLFQKKNRYKN